MSKNAGETFAIGQDGFFVGRTVLEIAGVDIIDLMPEDDDTVGLSTDEMLKEMEFLLMGVS